MNKKIGILGGTFDPIHLGHILIAKQAMEEYSLDEIWFLPTGKSPHKEASEVTSTFHRLNMVELAIQTYSKFFLCDYETKQEKVNYTFQTLKHLTEQYQETTFYFIMGQDSITDLQICNIIGSNQTGSGVHKRTRRGYSICQTAVSCHNQMFTFTKLSCILQSDSGVST